MKLWMEALFYEVITYVLTVKIHIVKYLNELIWLQNSTNCKI